MKTDEQLLADVHRQIVTMKKWYNKYCQYVPAKVKEHSEKLLKPNNFYVLRFDEETLEVPIFTVYDTPDKDCLHASLDEMLNQPEPPAEQKPKESDKEPHLRQILRNKYRSNIMQFSGKLHMLGREHASDREITFARLKYRRLILENEKGLVYGRHWTNLYNEIKERGWKCENNEDIHDLVQVMMVDKLVKFRDEYPTRLHWADSLVMGIDGDDSWERRHNVPDHDIPCIGPLPSLNDTPPSPFDGLKDGYKEVCEEYMNTWKKDFIPYVDAKLEDPEDAYEFKCSLLEKEKNRLDKEELEVLVEILVSNSRRGNDNIRGLYTKDRWNRQLALAILEMQQGGLLSWMCLPVYFKRVLNQEIYDEASEELERAKGGTDEEAIEIAQYHFDEAEIEMYREYLTAPAPIQERNAEFARDQIRRRIFEGIVDMTDR